MVIRRKFIAGLGAVATGSAAAVGAGAFDAAGAERTVSVAAAELGGPLAAVVISVAGLALFHRMPRT